MSAVYGFALIAFGGLWIATQKFGRPESDWRDPLRVSDWLMIVACVTAIIVGTVLVLSVGRDAS